MARARATPFILVLVLAGACRKDRPPGDFFPDSDDRFQGLEAGTHTIRFKGCGPSPDAITILPPANEVELAGIVLLRLEDMEGYKAATRQAQADAASKEAGASEQVPE